MSRPSRSSIRTKVLVPDNVVFSDSELKELKGAFDLFTNGSGKINPKELVDVVQGLGLEAQNPIVFGIISSLDNSKGRELDFDDFKEILTGSFGDFQTKSGVNNIFDLFDTEGRGIITAEHLKKLATLVGEKFSPDQLDLVASYASSNKKDITREDFYSMVARGFRD